MQMKGLGSSNKLEPCPSTFAPTLLLVNASGFLSGAPEWIPPGQRLNGSSNYCIFIELGN
jgi:hypothetical protein